MNPIFFYPCCVYILLNLTCFKVFVKVKTKKIENTDQSLYLGQLFHDTFLHLSIWCNFLFIYQNSRLVITHALFIFCHIDKRCGILKCQSSRFRFVAWDLWFIEKLRWPNIGAWPTFRIKAENFSIPSGKFTVVCCKWKKCNISLLLSSSVLGYHHKITDINLECRDNSVWTVLLVFLYLGFCNVLLRHVGLQLLFMWSVFGKLVMCLVALSSVTRVFCFFSLTWSFFKWNGLGVGVLQSVNKSASRLTWQEQNVPKVLPSLVFPYF